MCPFKTDRKAILDPFLDRRTKLLPCQREMIHVMYDRGLGITALSRIFNVNKRSIQFELFPERKAHNLELRKLRGGTMIYYKGGKEWAKTQREHRRYKYELLKDVI